MENQESEPREIPKTPEELAEQYSQEVADFFEIEKVPEIRAIFFKDKEELASASYQYMSERRKKQGKPAPEKMPDYLVGWNPPGEKWNEAWVVQEGSLDGNGRPIDQKRFSGILKHELTHAYISEFTGIRDAAFAAPANWLSEGICTLVAGQIISKYDGSVTLDLLAELSNTFDNRKFLVGRGMVETILRDYDKRKLLELLKIGNDPARLEKELRKMFKWLK